MAAFSSLGVGSNLDLSSLLAQLTTAERQPLIALETQAKSYTTKLSAYGTLQSSVGALQTASAKLSNLSLFQGVKAASSFNTVLTASAGTTAAAGTYAINVSQLAQSQSLATTGQASATTAIGSGTVTFDFGAIAIDDEVGSPTQGQQIFKSDASRSTTVEIGADSTLEGIRDAINAKKDAGVTASIVNDGSGTPFRLVLVSSKTGEASSMKISVAGGNAALETLMNHDPLGTPTMTETIAAKNAQLTVNGLAISSATNTVSEPMQGVTLTLAGKGDSTLTVARDTSSVTSAINAFVASYNSLLSTGKSLTTYDQDTKKGSALTGDATLRNLQVGIRAALTSPQSGATGDFTMLSNIGVTFQKDGTLAVDSTKLEAALSANMDGVAKLFAGTATDKAGYGKQLSVLALDLVGGSLKTAAEGVTSSIKRLDKQYDAMEIRINATVERYRKQFTQLDVLMSSMNSTTSYLTQQFDTMNANAGK